MTRGLARWAGLAAVAAGMAAVYLGGSPSAAQDAKKDPLTPASPDEAVTGFAGCRACHNEKEPIDVKDNPFAKKYKSHQFVLLSEGRTWNQQDPHSRAFEVLKSPLGQQMSRILKYDVTKAPQCLTCHAIDKTPGSPLPAAGTKEAEARFDTAEGITCSTCHGLRKAWQVEHPVEKPPVIPWRTYTPAKKEEYGMRNLRDPAVRGQFCATCHVGSAADNRVVTHEMYAAGHPPLPPFELGTFMECQPKHWGYPTDPALKFFTPEGIEAYPGAGPEFVKAHPNWQWDYYRFHPAAQEVYMARQVAAGAITALQAEMRMIAADARRAAKGHDLVDYARFDCFACHHDLKSPSDRQARGYDGPPGRPPLKAWTAALPGVVVEHAAGLPGMADVTGQFQQKWDAVRTAALSRPYGNPEELANAAAAMDAWCGDFLKKSENGGKPLYSAAETRRLLGMVAQAAVSPKWTADPEAAMHLTWAYVTLRNHGGEKIPDDKLKALGKTVPVQVRFPPYSTDMGEPRPAGEQIGPRLELFGRFQAKEFIARFRDLTGGK